MSSKMLVQNTNLGCVRSKYSTSEQGYFPDPFLKFVTDKIQKRSPLINRGYYIRAQAIHRNLRKALLNVCNENHQVICLGAGFDTTYFRLKTEGILSNKCCYYEIDFPSVLEQKLGYIMKCNQLLQQVEDIKQNDNRNIVLASRNFFLVGGDLYDLKQLEMDLIDGNLNFSLPTIFLSECVLNYMQSDRADDILRWAAEKFSSSIFIMYEQICPSDGFGYAMKEHFLRVGSPLLSINSYIDTVAQKERFLKLGWSDVVVKDLNRIQSELGDAEKARVRSLEPFDEFEEFHLKCSHYILATATKGQLRSTDNHATGPTNETVNCQDLQIDWEFKPCSSASRYGHAAAQLDKSQVLISGGFGDYETGHRRLTGMNLFNLHTGQQEDIQFEDPQDMMGKRIFHQQVILPCNQCFLVFGGRSSPSKALDRPALIIVRKLTCQENHQQSSALSNDSAVSGRDSNGNANHWRVENFHTTGEGPGHRWRHSATLVVNKKGEQKLVIFGGYNHERKTLGECYILNIQSSCWKKLELQSSSPCPRHSHSCTFSNGYLWLFGGLSSTEDALGDLYSFDVDTETWSEFKLQSRIIPRYSHTMNVWNNSMYLIGGVTNAYIATGSPGIARICLKTGQGCEYTVKPPPSIEPLLLFKHSSFIDESDGSIWIVGGGATCFTFGTFFNKNLLKLKIK